MNDNLVAMKDIRNLFQTTCNKNETELQWVRGVPDADITNCLINGVRVLAPGLTKLQNEKKKSKKNK